MSYTKIHTEALVLGSHDTGEASRVFALLTPRLGLVHARSQGVRELRSRHRYALQTLSFAEVSLVRGSHSWRVTNASPRLSLNASCARYESRDASIRVARLVRRLVRGEQKDEHLFALVESGIQLLSRSAHTSEDIRDAEALVVLRLLHLLGYLGREARFEMFVTPGAGFSPEHLAAMRPLRASAIRAINEALKASQL